MYKIIYLALCGSMLISASSAVVDTQNRDPYIDKNLLNSVYGQPSTNATTTKSTTLKPKVVSNILGISVDGDNIIIDTKKSRDILNSLFSDIDKGLGNIEKRIDKQRSHSINDAGIHIRKDQIVIDMNRTKNFVDELADSIDIIVDELNRTVEEMEKRLSQ